MKNVKHKTVLTVLIATIIIASTYAAWQYMNYRNYLDKTAHETNRWAVIEDSHGDIMAVEATGGEVWGRLVDLYENKNEKWVGGTVERFNNRWGFHFNPETITIADVTAEGSQTWIQDLSNNLEYWMGYGHTYVWAKVSEIHG